MHASQLPPPRIHQEDEPDVIVGHLNEGGAKLIEHRPSENTAEF
jgi:hypothetical protein